MTISFEQFRTVIADPGATAQLGIQISDEAAQRLLANEALALAFYVNWSRSAPQKRMARSRTIAVLAAVLASVLLTGIGSLVWLSQPTNSGSSTPTPTPRLATVSQLAGVVTKYSSEFTEWQINWKLHGCNLERSTIENDSACRFWLTQVASKAHAASVAVNGSEVIFGATPEEVRVLWGTTSQSLNSAADYSAEWGSDCSGDAVGCYDLGSKIIDQVIGFQDLVPAWAPYM